MSPVRPVLVLVSVLVSVSVSACTGKYVRPTTLEHVQSTPELLARGGYLVNQAMSCGACHSTKEGGNFLTGGERTDMYLAGQAVELPAEGFKFWMPNLTPDVETGLGGWSDDEIMRAVRDGIGKDGHLMFPMMPFSSYQHVSDEDLRAIVAYLRSVPPVKNKRTLAENDFGFFVEFFMNRGVMHHPPAHDVPPPKQDQLRYGEYVMRLGHCWECHSATSRGPKDVGEKEFLSGFDEPWEFPGLGKIYSRNLTPDPETGLGKYSAAQIKQSLRDGKRLDGKQMAPPMSLFIPHVSGMTDEDIDALVAFIKSVPPVKNKIPERQLTPAFEKTLAAK